MGRAASYLVAFVTGVALSLAFPQPDISVLAWVAFAPLLLTVDRVSLGRGYMLGLAFGVGFFGVLLAWIVNVGYVAYVLLVLMQAGLVGLFGLGWAAASRVDNAAVRIGGPGVVWVAVELIRTSIPFGGFTWGELAQSQHDYGWMLRPAAFAGRWAVSLVCVTCGALLAEAWRRRSTGFARAGAFGLAAAALIAVPLLLPSNHADGESARVAIVQGNVPEDWSGSIRDKEIGIIRRHVELTQGLDDDALDLVVWPESSVAIDPTRDAFAAQALRDAAGSAGAPMIVGGNEDIDADRYRVVAWLVDEFGGIEDTYVKTHLVPFGEYVPGRKLLQWLPLLAQVPRDAIADDESKVFSVAGGAVAPVLSFEGDFGSLVRARIDDGGRMLVVATNTSTWGHSWASVQHLAMSQVRAAETGVWVVHAAVSGTSAFVAPDGSIAQRSPLWTATTLTRDIGFSTEPTFYARTGDWLAYLCLVAALALVVVGARRPHVIGVPAPASSVP